MNGLNATRTRRTPNVDQEHWRKTDAFFNDHHLENEWKNLKFDSHSEGFRSNLLCI